MMGASRRLLWEPSQETKASARITRYLHWLAETRGLTFESYAELWRWSTTHLEDFWKSIWDHFEVGASRPPERVLSGRAMPGARWFPGAELNYAEHALRRRDQGPTIVARSEARGLDRLETVSAAVLAERVASVRAGLSALGVRRGDRVAAYVPNIPEAVVAFLATASLGAIWSACSPDFGIRAVVDRFQQIEPRVLLTVDGYRYGGRDFPRLEEVAQIQRALPPWRRQSSSPICRTAPRPRASAACVPGRTCSRPRASSPSSRSPSSTRSGSCTRRAPPACPRASCTVTGASCSST